MKFIKTLPQALLLGTGLFFSAHTALADPSDLDLSFSNDGKVAAAFGVAGSSAVCRDVKVQSDGKIVTAGSFGGNWAIARHTTAGVLDTTFNNDGKVTTNYGGDDAANALAIQSDGKIVAVGMGQGGSMVAITRYLSNGTHDTSFNGDGDSDGKIGTNFGITSATSFEGVDVAIQSDGKIVVAVRTNYGADGDDFIVARFLSNGSLDTSFSGDGMASITFGGYDSISCLALQVDGKILVGGGGNRNSVAQTMVLARLTTSGALDTTFDSDGKASVSFGGTYESSDALAVQSDGKIVLGGTSVTSGQLPPFQCSFALARFNSNGTLDTSFSGDGKVTTSVTGEATSSDIALESDGRIIQVGSITAGNIDFALVRYNSNGTRDTSFSSDGITTTDFYGDTIDEANAVAIDSSGKIVVTGTTGENFALARYLGAFNPPMPINGTSSQTF